MNNQSNKATLYSLKKNEAQKNMPNKLKKYHVIRDDDPNDYFIIHAENDHEAAILALENLGWRITVPVDKTPLLDL